MNIPTELQTARLLIRQFTKTDAESFELFMTNPSITDNLAFDDHLKSKEGALAILNHTIASYNAEQPLLAFAIVAKNNGSFMGACGINFLEQDKAEVFYAFFPEYWGKGFATEVLSKLKAYLVQMHAVKEIHAFIKPGNIASIKVAEKSGFINHGLVAKEGFSNKVFDYVLTI
ncbi:MAG TPA: GNAT family N-acetyltransferase [Flavisolibacter sp.]|jgi:ribosomal-protein-alanine N-acetyltransferase|nr:GNAT family N-acetyltransferase [Flavisolibacter sp.]